MESSKSVDSLFVLKLSQGCFVSSSDFSFPRRPRRSLRIISAIFAFSIVASNFKVLQDSIDVLTVGYLPVPPFSRSFRILSAAIARLSVCLSIPRCLFVPITVSLQFLVLLGRAQRTTCQDVDANQTIALQNAESDANQLKAYIGLISWKIYLESGRSIPRLTCVKD